MTKDELLEHLEYCTGDTQIMIRNYGQVFPISDANHRTVVESGERQVILIPNLPSKRKS